MASTEGSFLSGLRNSSGSWISLVGGWRSGTTTVLFWQCNAKGYEKDSIGTVMRSYFLEHEIALGSKELLIYGGTPHTMRYSFVEDPVLDLVVRQHSAKAQVIWWLLCGAAWWVRYRRRPNFFLDTISSQGLRWAKLSRFRALSLRGSSSGR